MHTTTRRLPTALLRFMLCSAALIAGLGATTLLTGCDNNTRVGEDPRVTPTQPRPDQPSR
jgi:hypothetical protein